MSREEGCWAVPGGHGGSSGDISQAELELSWKDDIFEVHETWKHIGELGQSETNTKLGLC